MRFIEEKNIISYNILEYNKAKILIINNNYYFGFDLLYIKV